MPYRAHAAFEPLVALLPPIDGDSGDDSLDGTSCADGIHDFGAQDHLMRQAGSDTRFRGAARDRIWCRTGSDNLNGGDVPDRLWAGAGDDVLPGGSGPDTFVLSARADKLYRGSGSDNLDASGWYIRVRVKLTPISRIIFSDTEPDVEHPAHTIEDLGGLHQAATSIENFVITDFNDSLRIDTTGGVAKGRDGNHNQEKNGSGNKVYGGGDSDTILMGGYTRSNTSYPGSFYGGSGGDRMGLNSTDTNSFHGRASYREYGGAGADIFDFIYCHSRTIADFTPADDKIDISIHVGYQNLTWHELRAMLKVLEYGGTKLDRHTDTADAEIFFLSVRPSDLCATNFMLHP